MSTADPAGGRLHRYHKAVAAHERRIITARTRRGRLTKAAKGGYAGGRVPYGYAAQRGSGVLTVNEEEVLWEGTRTSCFG